MSEDKIKNRKKRKRQLEKSFTGKQITFCHKYIIYDNGTKAAIDSGYSENSARSIASENLTKPDIWEYIEILREELAERNEVTADYVLKNFQKVFDRCMQVEEIRMWVDNELVGTGVYQFNAAAANFANTKMGEHIGFFKKDNEQRRPVTVNQYFQDYHDLKKKAKEELRNDSSNRIAKHL